MIAKIIDNIKTLIIALVIAIIIRSLFFQPFYIPSSSMEPTLLVGDRIFVSKYTYGFSKHSFPFSLPIFNGRILFNKPKRGDAIVFKTPYKGDDIFPINLLCKILTTCKTDYIKRLIGLPGDEIKFINGDLFINGQQVFRIKINHDSSEKINCGSTECIYFSEKLPNGVIFKTSYMNSLNTITRPWFINGVGEETYNVPEDHYFFLGDNRNNSADSRYSIKGTDYERYHGVGYVHKNNLIGKAKIIFFSNDTKKGSVLKFWNWKNSIRINRFFKKLK